MVRVYRASEETPSLLHSVLESKSFLERKEEDGNRVKGEREREEEEERRRRQKR